MNAINLDGNLMTNRTDMHRYISKTLNFPEYYGNNLDALYDILSTIGQETYITILHSSSIKLNLGGYGKIFLQVLENATECNKKLHIKFQ